MAAVGQALWTDDEGLMNAVTAVSGSGPAYIFLLIECLAKAGENSGLPADMAMALARETVIGSAASPLMPPTPRRNIARKCYQPRRHYRRRAWRFDGSGQRLTAIDGQSRCRRHRAWEELE